MQKNDRLNVCCTGLGSELEGICTHEGMTLFVPGILPQEKADVQIVKVQPRYAFGRLIQICEASEERRDPPCPAYRLCGGCSGQHMTYAATLEAKRTQAEECLRRIGGFSDLTLPAVLGAEDPWHCRNKTALPIGGTAENPKMGFYRRRSHDIVDIEDCPVTMGSLKPLLSAVKDWIRQNRIPPYNELTGKGILRHAVVRTNRRGEMLLTLVATKNSLPRTEDLARVLCNAIPGFIGLHLSVNAERNNVILGTTSRRLWGAEAIEETLLGLTFSIPPLSFFQVNPVQCERLYETAIRMAKLSPRDTVVDAYAGAGTISLCMAKQCAKVIGIEIVPQAIEGAKENAARNGIGNAEFHTAAVEDLLPKLVSEGLRPDVIVLDPPRKGVEPAVIQAVLEAKPRRVVYVSCHVPTQARDAKLLCEGGYRIEAGQPVDMFCWAGGVENVMVLSKLSSAKHIDIHLDMKELDVTKAETEEGATYEEIKAYVKEHSGLKVSALYIAQVKRKYGIIERECYNKPKSEYAQQPQCPGNKEKAIVEALKFFGMIA